MISTNQRSDDVRLSDVEWPSQGHAPDHPLGTNRCLRVRRSRLSTSTVLPASTRRAQARLSGKDIDREFVTSAKKIGNFNEFSEIKKIVKIRKKNSLNARV